MGDSDVFRLTSRLQEVSSTLHLLGLDLKEKSISLSAAKMVPISSHTAMHSVMSSCQRVHQKASAANITQFERLKRSLRGAARSNPAWRSRRWESASDMKLCWSVLSTGACHLSPVVWELKGSLVRLMLPNSAKRGNLPLKRWGDPCSQKREVASSRMSILVATMEMNSPQKWSGLCESTEVNKPVKCYRMWRCGTSST